MGFDVGHATVLQLRAALRAHKVQWTGARAELVARVRQLVASGPLGLPRAGRVDVGGRREPQRSTVRDVAGYWESFAALRTKTVVWDNAPTHSAVRVQNHTQISLFHRLFRE